jgi:hypothetical protein
LDIFHYDCHITLGHRTINSDLNQCELDSLLAVWRRGVE